MKVSRSWEDVVEVDVQRGICLWTGFEWLGMCSD